MFLTALPLLAASHATGLFREEESQNRIARVLTWRNLQSPDNLSANLAVCKSTYLSINDIAVRRLIALQIR
jgi:hypothetical protein